jgi:NACalpha-BTF3-like transcription factor
LLSQRDLEEIRERLGDWFAEAESIEQLLQQLASDQDERKQLLVIEKLRDAKGTAYTEGLVQALRIVRGGVQQAAREALADRMMRMTPSTLRDKLGSDQEELRLAAIRAAGDKKAEDLVPDLIELVMEKNAAVRNEAGKALRAITGKDFGPAPNASFEDQFYARKQWRAWWDANSSAKR